MKKNKFLLGICTLLTIIIPLTANAAVVLGNQTVRGNQTVAGNLTVNGTVTENTPKAYTYASGITAGTTQTQAGATLLTKEFNEVSTVATAGDGVRLPTAVAGIRAIVKNNGTKILNVYPFLADSIDSLSANLPVTVQPGSIAFFYAKSGIVWESSVGGFKPTEPGTANTGVTSLTYGDGKSYTTILTVSKADAVTVADNAALADGYLLYTLPAGPTIIQGAYMSMSVTCAEDTTATLDGGLGTTIGSGVQSVLSGVGAASENILTGQTFADSAGTAKVKTVADQVLVIETAGDHTIYFNIADTWANTAGSDLDCDIAGTVTIKWVKMS